MLALLPLQLNLLVFQVSIPSLSTTGFIPVEHVSDFPGIGPHLLQCYTTGDIIKEAVIWISSKLQTVLTLKPTIVNFAKEKRFPPSVEDIGVNSIFPCVSARRKPFGVFAQLLCPPSKCDVLFPCSKMPPKLYSALEKEDVQHISMEGQVIKVDKKHKKVFVSVVDGAASKNAAQLLYDFFQEQERIRAHLMESSDEGLKSLAKMKLGDVVVGKLLMEFDPTADLEFELPNGVKGIVPAYHHAEKAFKKNDLIVGSVLFCDPIHQVAYVTTRDDVISHITDAASLQPKGKKQKGKILLNMDYFSLVSFTDGSIKGVAFTSNIRNINEASAPLPSPYQVGTEVDVVIDSTKLGSAKIATYNSTPPSWRTNRSKKRAATADDGPGKKKAKKEVQTTVNKPKNAAKEDDGLSVETKTKKKHAKKKAQQVMEVNGAEAEEVVKPDEPSAEKKKTKGQKNSEAAKLADENEATKKDTSSKKATKGKRSTSESEDKAEACPAEKKEVSSPAKKRKLETSAKPVKGQGKVNPLDLPRLSIASAFKWDDDMTSLPPTTTIPDSSDSEDEDEDKGKAVVKDRRERAKEKLEQAKQDEAKLSQIEEELNNPDRTPVTTDDFDRMVLASPNSSILWLQYMAFHLENAEIEKARTVAQRALKIMSFREDQEKFNVWIAWLNLEHMYGTTEGYEATLQVIINQVKSNALVMVCK